MFHVKQFIGLRQANTQAVGVFHVKQCVPQCILDTLRHG